MKNFKTKFIEKRRNYTIFLYNPHCRPNICSNMAHVFRFHFDRSLSPNFSISLIPRRWVLYSQIFDLPILFWGVGRGGSHSGQCQVSTASMAAHPIGNLPVGRHSSLEGAVLSISIFNTTPRARNVAVHHEYFSTASVSGLPSDNEKNPCTSEKQSVNA